MKILEEINPELIEILEPYMQWFFDTDYENLPVHKNGDWIAHNSETASARKYLQEVMSDASHKGPPELSKIRDLQAGPDIPDRTQKKVK